MEDGILIATKEEHEVEGVIFKGNTRVQCQICGKPGHMAFQCYHCYNQAYIVPTTILQPFVHKSFVCHDCNTRIFNWSKLVSWLRCNHSLHTRYWQPCRQTRISRLRENLHGNGESLEISHVGSSFLLDNKSLYFKKYTSRAQDYIKSYQCIQVYNW